MHPRNSTEAPGRGRYSHFSTIAASSACIPLNSLLQFWASVPLKKYIVYVLSQNSTFCPSSCGYQGNYPRVLGQIECTLQTHPVTNLHTRSYMTHLRQDHAGENLHEDFERAAGRKWQQRQGGKRKDRRCAPGHGHDTGKMS